jgi:hypothetical protein
MLGGGLEGLRFGVRSLEFGVWREEFGVWGSEFCLLSSRGSVPRSRGAPKSTPSHGADGADALQGIGQQCPSGRGNDA